MKLKCIEKSDKKDYKDFFTVGVEYLTDGASVFDNYHEDTLFRESGWLLDDLTVYSQSGNPDSIVVAEFEEVIDND